MSNRKTFWEFFIDNYKFTFLLVGALVVFGLVSAVTLTKESDPEVNIPIAVVSTPFIGASVEEVEELITTPIEDKISGIGEIDTVSSLSRSGLSSITVEFDAKADADKVIDDLKDKVDEAIPDLPDDAEDPIVTKVTISDQAFLIVSLSGPYELPQITSYAKELESEIERIAGVSEAELVGGKEREFSVIVNKAQLDGFGLSLSQVTQAISAANSDIPIGSIETGGEEFQLRFAGRLKTQADVAQVPVGSVNGVPVLVQDIAVVEDGFADVNSVSKLSVGGGEAFPAVSINVKKSPGADVVRISDKVAGLIADAETRFPENVDIAVTQDTAEYIRQDLGNLTANGIATVTIVIILLIIFIGFKEALMAGFSIPLAFLMTFVGLFYLGMTINFITLFALILALGILVDSAIVINEGLSKNMKAGKTAKEAAVYTIREFEYPLMSGTLTTVFAFVPMLLTGGIVGEYIKSIPVTVTLVLVSSLFIALAIVPTIAVVLSNKQKVTKATLAAKLLSFADKPVERLKTLHAEMEAKRAASNNVAKKAAFWLIAHLIDWKIEFHHLLHETVCLLQRILRPILAPFLRLGRRVAGNVRRVFGRMRARIQTIFAQTKANYAANLQAFLEQRKKRIKLRRLLIFLFIFSFALPATGLLRVEMFPVADVDFFSIDVEKPVGTPIHETAAIMDVLVEELYDDPRIKSASINVGSTLNLSGQGGSRGNHLAHIFVNLKDVGERDEKSFVIVEEYQQKLQDFDLADVTVSQPSSGPPGSAPVEVKIAGADLTVLDDIIVDMTKLVSSIDGTKNVRSSVVDTNGQFVVYINRIRAQQFGVSTSQVALTLRNAISGLTATELTIDGEDVDVVVKYGLDERDGDIDSNAVQTDINTIEALTISTPTGDIPLASIVDIKLENSRQSIRHENGDRVVSVTADVTGDTTPLEVFSVISSRLDEVEVPAGYSVTLGGENEDTAESFADMLRAMILAVILIAALLVLQFRSYKQSTLILITIPLSLIGVFPGLMIMNQPISFPGVIGIVALAGIVVNNAIILIDRINNNRAEGMALNRAIVEAGRSRMEPIILTTITTVFGILPLALTQEVWASLGYAIIYGLMFSTVTTLYVIPILYRRMHRHENGHHHA